MVRQAAEEKAVGTDQHTMDPEKLLLKIGTGKKLSEEECAHVVEQLQSVDTEDLGRKLSVDDVYSYLVVLGRAKLFQHRNLLERYLETRDPLTVALVLEMLCLDWKFVEQYIERVVNFALGVAWDNEDDVRLMALKILGEYLQQAALSPGQDKKKLASTRSKECQTIDLYVLELLFSVFDDEEISAWTRQAAYSSLCRAAGKAWDEIPGECVQIDFGDQSSDLDREMLASLRRLMPSSGQEIPSMGTQDS